MPGYLEISTLHVRGFDRLDRRYGEPQAPAGEVTVSEEPTVLATIELRSRRLSPI